MKFKQLLSAHKAKAFALSSIFIAVMGVTTTSAVQAYDRHYDTVSFKQLSTFDVMDGNGTDVAEIIDATPNGKGLVYTDSETGSIGFVNIKNPNKPKADGTVVVGGEPTSLVVNGRYVLVATNTSESFTNPSGKLVVVDRKTHTVVAEHELGGQPDSLALSPNKDYLAIVIENERDEDLDGGLIPQAGNPTGSLLIVDLTNDPANWSIRKADLSSVAANAFAGADLEPEFVDINEYDEAVVTFQENNHLAIIDLKTGNLINDFSAGSAFLFDVDSNEDDLISFDSSFEKRREPDAVTWIDGDHFATANEGDYEDKNGEEGGSRGFTIFNLYGDVVYESGETFEHWLASAGHYNEGRSENKGCEPEGIESGKFGGRTLLFVGSERCNAIGVYDVTHGYPEPIQILPTGMGPEGLKAIAKRNLFIASTEKDEADTGIPTMVNIFRLSFGEAAYPMIQSETDYNLNPIPWVALSGLVGDYEDANTLYAVSDSFLAEGYIYTVDVSEKPAKIIDRMQVTGASAGLDLEGIAQGTDGHFWLGSEGNADTRANLVLKVDPTGAVVQEINLPAELELNRRKNGIEGIAVTGEAGAEVIYVAIQRAWPDAIGGDEDKVNTKVGRYDVASGEWTFVHYPLEAEGNGGWIGLSDLTLLPNGKFAVIERDKGWGPSTGLNAEHKAIYGIDLRSADFRKVDDTNGLVTIEKRLLRDVLPDLEKASIWTSEKLEGMAVSANGAVYVVTDNDGVDDVPGETVFLNLGQWKRAFNPLRNYRYWRKSFGFSHEQLDQYWERRFGARSHRDYWSR